uniref:Cell division cycle associated 7b n=1 Tax=Sinocyclocheilus rhinocerous TaxID=307959 RepID=A0A673HGE8_9TELE
MCAYSFPEDMKTQSVLLYDVDADELAQAFMDTESEGEFEGFSADECDWRKPVVNMTKKPTYSYNSSFIFVIFNMILSIILIYSSILAKLFADLSSLPELPSKTTPTKRKKQSTPKRCFSEVQVERRNPGRKARPPEHFGKEVEENPAPPKRESGAIDIKRLMEVKEGPGDARPKQRKCRSQESIRMPEDITEEELENVADRAKDKILDKENGSTCHQCRQKTLDTKTECRGLYCGGVKGQFCGPCLRNRYGEDVRAALLDPSWECPICRGVCNCSLCRKRDGRCATGALTRLAKFFGHDNVRDYLESLQKDVE